MNIVFFTHPSFVNHQSMPRFANMLVDGMKVRGHQVQVWAPRAKFQKLVNSNFAKKWFGYIDQYINFPNDVKGKIDKLPKNTLFVFTDQALGPWVPLVSNRPNVIHCHDFLAQYSALGQIQENKTAWFGTQYQKYIRNGYQQGRNFISVSNKTKEDLHEFLLENPSISEVVYNGLNRNFEPGDKYAARKKLGDFSNLNLQNGYILHVGGNQWYKNRKGVLKIYKSWRKNFNKELPLILIGEAPNMELISERESVYKDSIFFLEKVPDNLLIDAYVGASIFLFPSLAEGFGWPIAEAMACGCPVITTNEAPMTEVANGEGKLIDRMPLLSEDIIIWSNNSAKTLESLLLMEKGCKVKLIEGELENVKRFHRDSALDKIEKIYQKVLENEIIL